MSYEVSSTDLGTIYAGTPGSSPILASADHAKKVTVYGVTATGKKVALPSSYYNIIDQSELTATAPTGTETEITVAGLNTNIDVDSTTTDKLDTIDAGFTVVINSTGETFNITAKSTAVAPKATELKLVDPTKNDAVLSTAKDINKDGVIDVNDFVISSPNNTTQELIVVDQYGVEMTSTPVVDNLSILFTSLVDNGTKGATIVANGTVGAKVNQFGEDDTVDLKLTVGKATLSISAVPTVTFAPDFASEVVTFAKQGTNTGYTKLNLIGMDAANTYYYKADTSADARQIEGATAETTGYTEITGGTADIDVSTNKVITLIAVNTTTNKVVSYKSVTVPSDKIQ